MATALKFQFDSIPSDKYLIVAWYKNTAPLAEVGRQAYSGPHMNQLRTLSPNIGKATYTFKFFQSTNGTTLETQIRTWDIDGTVSANKILETYEYVVGRGSTGDPMPDSTILSDSRLEDALKTELEVKRRGVGTLINNEFELYAGGGIELQNGDVFGDGEIIHITRQYQQDAVTTETAAATEDIITISSNTTFDASTHLNKIIYLAGGANIVEFLFTAFSVIPDGKIKFNTNASTARYLRLQFAVGNSVSFFGQNRNKIYLGKGESIELLFKSNVCYAVSPVKETGYERVGETDMSNYKDIPNTVICDGDGVEHWITDYDRLLDRLPSEMKVTYAQWNQSASVVVAGNTIEYFYNRRKFAVDTTNGKFKFPDLRGIYFKTLAHFDGTNDAGRLSQGAGGMMPMQLLKHKHAIRGTDGDSGGANTVVDFGDTAKTIQNKTEPCMEVGGDSQEVDNAGKYGIVWI